MFGRTYLACLKGQVVRDGYRGKTTWLGSTWVIEAWPVGLRQPLLDRGIAIDCGIEPLTFVDDGGNVNDVIVIDGDTGGHPAGEVRMQLSENCRLTYSLRSGQRCASQDSD